MRAALLGAVIAGLAIAGPARASGRTPCAAILPTPPTAAAKRALTPLDLVQLRDIGPVEPQTFAAPFFTVSPDGRSAAFQLRQADAARNAYCLAMVVADLSGKKRPAIVDSGGEPLLLTTDFRGIADFPSGLMRVVTPRWSPDGRWFAFLKRLGGRTRVWRAFTGGQPSEAVTPADKDVADFALAPDGSGIIYSTRPGIASGQKAAAQEGLDGWHYDDRFVPLLSKRPLLRAPVARQVEVISLRDRTVREASAEEVALVADRELIAVAGAEPLVADAGLRIKATDLAGGAQPGSLVARLAGADRICMSPACAGAMSPWWMAGKTHARFFRREGWAHGSTAIYDWDVRTGAVRKLYETEDILSSCTADRASLICLADSSLEPRRLIRLDPATGRRTTLFDPNPEFAGLLLGRPQRLHWRSAFGVETLADLVLPVGYEAGRRYPLIVVQYDTRGFLRGGTGDEYPIQAFANRGYAVLSFSRPRPPASKAAPKDYEEAGRLDLRGFTDRRNVQSSLEMGIRMLIERGIADPARIAITGLSDGSSTLEWELSHSSMFAAAATSSCCWDPFFLALVGPSAAQHFLAEGYPGILGRTDPFWKDMTLIDHARSMRTPLLINASEEEMLTALPTYTALREAGVPVDLFVYPEEFHVRWQPAHRLATYRRSLDWFDYWLRGIRSTAPDRQSELREWDRLRDKARAAAISAGSNALSMPRH